jgi:hypothetical protein
MRLYGAIQKVEPLDDGTVRVHGIATSEAVDDQGEIVRADAMRAAIPDYLRFPALREMHQLSAAGTTLDAEVYDDGTTRIVAHVVDPVAVTKVKNQVSRGFSIGGRVTQREAGNPKAITSLVLNEISLVDRPANPEAIFDCWKAAIAAESRFDRGDHPDSTWRLADLVRGPSDSEPFNSPIQIWTCAIPDHRHLAKADAIKCQQKLHDGSIGARTAIAPATVAMAKAETVAPAAEYRENSVAGDEPDGAVQYADPGYQPDGKKRYPIHTRRHIRAAWTHVNRPGNAGKYSDNQLKRITGDIIISWKETIGGDGPPFAENREKASRTALTKALWDVGHIARVIIDLDWLKDNLDLEAAAENDNSPQPARLQAIITELCEFLNALVAEETAELLSDGDTDAATGAPAMSGILAMAAGVSGAAHVAALLQKGKPNMRNLAAGLIAKAKHSQGDQALMDMAHLACDKCLKIGGLSADETEDLGKARHHLQEAGAVPIQDRAADTTEDDDPLLLGSDWPLSVAVGLRPSKCSASSLRCSGNGGQRTST